jgi:hypothetical protein
VKAVLAPLAVLSGTVLIGLSARFVRQDVRLHQDELGKGFDQSFFGAEEFVFTQRAAGLLPGDFARYSA